MTFCLPLKASVLAVGLALACPPLLAQDGGITFGGLKTDISLPVQVKADSLSINQADGQAVFSGNVAITQGAMVLTAQVVSIRYGADSQTIASLHAEGGVSLTAGSDGAQADSADYLPDTGDLILSGNVRLSQGAASISGQKLVLNLETGLGTMSGGVTTVFSPGDN